MKVLIFTPVWSRGKVTELCYVGLKRFMKTLNSKGIESEVLIIGSPEDEFDQKSLALKNNFKYISVKNRPVANKHNEGLKYALKKLDWDYLMQVSSDNFIKDEYADHILEHASNKVPMFGVDRCALVCSKELKQFSFKVWKEGRLGGVARLLRRDILQGTIDHFGFVWQPHKNRALDYSSEKQIQLSQRVKPFIIDLDTDIAIDIKSNVNINAFNGMYRTAIKRNKVAAEVTDFNGFTPELTLEALRNLD